jgi:transcriptional regulator
VYVNPDFRGDTRQAHDLLERWPFAVLIALDPSVQLSFAPVELRRDQGPYGTLVGHVSAADPVAAALRSGTALRVAFLGPSWYSDPGLPTYNFGAVEAIGTAQPFDDPWLVKQHLMALVASHEGARTDDQEKWRPDGWARSRIQELLGELQAFAMPIDQLEVKIKMGQNRTPGDRLGTIAGLTGGGAPHGAEAAALMRSWYGADGCPR